MKTIRHIVTIAAVITIAILGALAVPRVALAADDDEARQTLDSLEARLGWVQYRLGLETWRQLTDADSDSLAFFLRLHRSVLSRSRDYDRLRGVRARLRDDVERRRYDLVWPRLVWAQIDHGAAVGELYDSLVEFYSGDWCVLEAQPVTLDEALVTIARNRRRPQREAAFRAWASPGEEAEQQLARLFRLRNQAARRMGYNDFLSLSADLGRFEISDYRQQIDDIAAITQSAYDRVTAELRTSVESGSFEIWDWEQRFANTWNDVDRSFPADSHMTFVRRLMAGIGFDLNQLPIYWDVSIAGDGPGHVETIVVKAPHDIRIVARLSNGLDGYLRLVQAVGKAVQAARSAQESDLLSRATDPVSSEAVAAVFARLGLVGGWLQSHAGVSSGLATRVAQAEFAVRLLHVRLLLVDARFEYEVYQNPNRDLNALYWDLFVQYTGLPRHDDLAPWAGREEYVTQPLAFYHRLLGQAAAAQSLDYLDKHYDRIVDNREIGSFLTHNYFRFGARYGWRDLLERATGEPFSPSHLTAR